MRARFVNEENNFERGQDPNKSMNIGARKNAVKLDRISFQKWTGNNLDGGYENFKYNPGATHEYLQTLADGNFEGPDPNYIDKHPTRVRFKTDDDHSLSWRELGGKAIVYEDELYIMPKELGDVLWKKKEIY